jgi:hypothetical protein
MTSNKIEDMMHEYQAAFASLGFDVRNKDLIEVLTFLVNELTKTKVDLYNVLCEVRGSNENN